MISKKWWAKKTSCLRSQLSPSFSSSPPSLSLHAPQLLASFAVPSPPSAALSLLPPTSPFPLSPSLPVLPLSVVQLVSRDPELPPTPKVRERLVDEVSSRSEETRRRHWLAKAEGKKKGKVP